ncbi:hypothetical protein KC19_VG045800 [Ceratodon purpureus]|uniref:Uncharacterized protein n=1 Tax=Ceratodon purpureus TaxID=3225 RepID=A0A8T0HM94_CERPU|nr:hypothetical protein KC19_VG045800 [Ceratodon purpureus]
MVIVYNKDFGVKLPRRDGYNGNPSWLESSIREYELGTLGPRHDCETRCDCVACDRLRWLRSGICRCELRLEWGKSLEIDFAMRQKMLRCRCSPFTVQYIDESFCTCRATFPTKEFVPSSLSDLNLPSEFDDSFDGGTRSGPVCGVSCFEDVLRMVSRIDCERIQAAGPNVSAGHTEIIVNDGFTELISGESHGTSLRRRASPAPSEHDLEGHSKFVFCCLETSEDFLSLTRRRHIADGTMQAKEYRSFITRKVNAHGVPGGAIRSTLTRTILRTDSIFSVLG